VTGSNLILEMDEFFEESDTLVCHSSGGCKVVLTPLSPTTIRHKTRGNRARLTQVAVHNPLLSLPRGTQQHEISVLNGGMLFDLELPLAWKGLTGQQVDYMDRLWLYIIPD
jgi:hypothetical protein